jgi:hypothetical protein
VEGKTDVKNTESMSRITYAVIQAVIQTRLTADAWVLIPDRLVYDLFFFLSFHELGEMLCKR